MTKAFKAPMVGGAFGLIAILSTAVWAETPAPADIALEDAYLDVLPKVEIPDDVQPIPGAVNEEFRNCEATSGTVRPPGPQATHWRGLALRRGPCAISTALCAPEMSFPQGTAAALAKWQIGKVLRRSRPPCASGCSSGIASRCR